MGLLRPSGHPGCAAFPARATDRERELQREVEAVQEEVAGVRLQCEAAIRLGPPRRGVMWETPSSRFHLALNVVPSPPPLSHPRLGGSHLHRSDTAEAEAAALQQQVAQLSGTLEEEREGRPRAWTMGSLPTLRGEGLAGRGAGRGEWLE